jgi:hypothetical protein
MHDCHYFFCPLKLRALFRRTAGTWIKLGPESDLLRFLILIYVDGALYSLGLYKKKVVLDKVTIKVFNILSLIIFKIFSL